MLMRSASRPRRGTIAIVVTPSTDTAWVRPLAALRSGGATPIACIVDPLGEGAGPSEADRTASAPGAGGERTGPTDAERAERRLRAVLHALTEHDVVAYVIRPDRPLGDQLVSGRRSVEAVA
jgi:hypothetical protein